MRNREMVSDNPEVILLIPLFCQVFFTEPVGICLIASYLRRQGIPAKVDDGFLRGDSARHVALRTVDACPRVVGISTNEERALPKTVQLAALLRDLGYKGIIIAGGTFAGMSYEELLKSGHFDYVVLGDGEESLCEIVRRAREGRRADGIAGVTSARCAGMARQGLDDIDVCPPMDRSVLREMIRLNGGSISGIQATVSTSRGCFSNCAYCSIQTGAAMNYGRRFRQRSMRSIVKEMEEIYIEFGLRAFYFSSAQFLPHSKRQACEVAAEFRRLVEALPFDPSVFLYLRCDSVERGIIRDLRNAGVTTLFLGVESFDDITLERLGKGLTSAQIIQAMEVLESEGYNADYRSPYRLKLGFIMFTPWTNISGIEKNLRYCRRFRIPPKKMLYSLQLHPKHAVRHCDSGVETRNDVNFLKLQGPEGMAFAAYRSFFSTMFIPLESIRAFQKAELELEERLRKQCWRIVDGLNQIAYDAFESIIRAAPHGEANLVSERERSAVITFLNDMSFDAIFDQMKTTANRTDCVGSHFNRGMDNPQVVSMEGAAATVRYP